MHACMHTQMRKLSFPELAFAVISRYVSEEDIPHQDLKEIINRSYSTFRSAGTDRVFDPTLKVDDMILSYT